MSWFFLAKLIHILSGAVLFGTGAGIAFFMFMAWRNAEPAGFASIAKHIVLADFLFTTTAVIVQTISGVALILLGGHDPFAVWLLISYGLFVLVGVCWLSVVGIQMKVRRLAGQVADGDGSAQPQIDALMRRWFIFGWPAFVGIVAIYFLMIVKP